MKVRMKVDISGTDGRGKSWPKRGGEVEVSDAAGAKLCAGGLAEPVAEREQPEKAVTPEPEKRRTPRKKAAGRGDAESS